MRTSLDLLGRFEAQRDLHRRAADRQAAEQALAEQDAQAGRGACARRCPQGLRIGPGDGQAGSRASATQGTWYGSWRRSMASSPVWIRRWRRARELHERWLRQRALRQSLQVDAKALKRLRKVEEELARLAIRQEAVATRPQFDLREAGALTWAASPERAGSASC